jgi:hypothetical protein
MIKKPQWRRPRPDLGCRVIGWPNSIRREQFGTVTVPESQDGVAHQPRADQSCCQHGEALVDDPAEVAVRVTARTALGLVQQIVSQLILNAAAVREQLCAMECDTPTSKHQTMKLHEVSGG